MSHRTSSFSIATRWPRSDASWGTTSNSLNCCNSNNRLRCLFGQSLSKISAVIRSLAAAQRSISAIYSRISRCSRTPIQVINLTSSYRSPNKNSSKNNYNSRNNYSNSKSNLHSLLKTIPMRITRTTRKPESSKITKISSLKTKRTNTSI